MSTGTPRDPAAPPPAGVGALPPPRGEGPYAVGLVCLGNICRSPTAEVVLRDEVGRAGLADRVALGSCGTGDWHVGRPMDARAAATLRGAGLDPDAHRARHLDASWAGHDLLLVMDEANRRDVLARDLVEPDRVRMFRDWDPLGPGLAVPDPYYGGDDGFEEVLTMVRRTATSLVAALAALLAGPGAGGDR